MIAYFILGGIIILLFVIFVYILYMWNNEVSNLKTLIIYKDAAIKNINDLCRCLKQKSKIQQELIDNLEEQLEELENGGDSNE